MFLGLPSTSKSSSGIEGVVSTSGVLKLKGCLKFWKKRMSTENLHKISVEISQITANVNQKCQASIFGTVWCRPESPSIIWRWKQKIILGGPMLQRRIILLDSWGGTAKEYKGVSHRRGYFKFTRSKFQFKQMPCPWHLHCRTAYILIWQALQDHFHLQISPFFKEVQYTCGSPAP